MPRPNPPGSGIATTDDERPQPAGLAAGLIPVTLSPGIAAGLIPATLPPGLAIALELAEEGSSFFLKMDGDNLLLMSGDDMLLVN